MAEKEQAEEKQAQEAYPYTLELHRGQKGTYSWDIKVRAVTRAIIQDETAKIDSWLRERYTTPPAIES